MNKVFIIGVGRSGTSLLQSMLNAHPKITILPETQFLRNFILKNPLEDISSENLAELRIKMKSDEKFARLKIYPDELSSGVTNKRELYIKLLKKYSEGKNIELIGDKDPRLIDYLIPFSRLNLSPKIIHIMRDPRGVVASRMKADWSKKWPFFMHVFLYKAQFEYGRRLGKKLFGHNYTELYYKELVSNPSGELEKICCFLEVSYNKRMLEFQESAKKLMDDREIQWKRETTGPLLSENVEKWKNSLSISQVYFIEQICSKEISNHKFGRSDFEKPSIGFRVYTALMIPVSRIFQLIYPLRIRL